MLRQEDYRSISPVLLFSTILSHLSIQQLGMNQAKKSLLIWQLDSWNFNRKIDEMKDG